MKWLFLVFICSILFSLKERWEGQRINVLSVSWSWYFTGIKQNRKRGEPGERTRYNIQNLCVISSNHIVGLQFSQNKGIKRDMGKERRRKEETGKRVALRSASTPLNSMLCFKNSPTTTHNTHTHVWPTSSPLSDWSSTVTSPEPSTRALQSFTPFLLNNLMVLPVPSLLWDTHII